MRRDVLLRSLRENGILVFRTADIARMTGQGTTSVNVLLHRLARGGWVWRVSKGIYSITRDPYVVGTSVTHPSYVSFASAYHLHGIITQMPMTLTVATSRPRKAMDTEVGRIAFVQVRPSMVFGFKRERRGDGEARIADLEKATLDSLYLPRHAAFADTLEAIRQCDASILESYAERSGVEALRRRVGYLLQQLRGGTSIRPAGATVHTLNPDRKVRGRFEAGWRLYVNEVVEA